MALLLALALLAPFAAAQGQSGDAPRFEENDQRYELKNGEIVVWFQGKKPLLKVFPSENDSREYEVHMLRLAEFQDGDGDRAYDENEEVAYVNLAKAEGWNVTVDEADGALHVTLRKTGEIRTRGPAGSPGLPDVLPGMNGTRTANVSLVFHVYDSPQELEASGNRTIHLAASEVKFDLAVEDWDWVDPDDGRLALVMNLPLGENATADTANGTTQVNVSQNGTELGHVGWVPTAQVTNGTNTTDAEVVPSFRVEDDETAHVSWAYDASGYDELVHDPTLGTASTDDDSGDRSVVERFEEVPAPGTIALLAVVGVAALAVRVRRGG